MCTCKKVFFSILFLFLSSCNPSIKTGIANTKYNNLYIEVFSAGYNDNIIFSNKINLKFLQKNQIVVSWLSPPVSHDNNIKIYKDDTKQCLIGFYRDNKIANILANSNQKYNMIFLILDKDNKLIPISKKEFEQNKQNGVYRELEFNESDCIKKNE